MKAIDLRQALIEANNVNLNGADALVETRAMRQLIESCKARIEELEPEATELAKAELTKLGIPKGQFMHEGYKFEAQRTDEYDSGRCDVPSEDSRAERPEGEIVCHHQGAEGDQGCVPDYAPEH